MTDRIPLDHLNSDQYDQLCDELARARARADRLAADLTGWRNLAAEHQQATIAALERAETAEAALDRVRRLAARIRQGVPWASNFDNLAGRILTALDGEQPGPAATEATGHVYLSTGCWHGDHAYCQSMTGLNGAKRPGSCKHCGARCICGCHTDTKEN